MLEKELQALPDCTTSDIAMFRNGSVPSKYRRHRGEIFTGSASAV
jgi:hypothetical protein